LDGITVMDDDEAFDGDTSLDIHPHELVSLTDTAT
jgi:hypothetical protein